MQRLPSSPRKPCPWLLLLLLLLLYIQPYRHLTLHVPATHSLKDEILTSSFICIRGVITLVWECTCFTTRQSESNLGFKGDRVSVQVSRAANVPLMLISAEIGMRPLFVASEIKVFRLEFVMVRLFPRKTLTPPGTGSGTGRFELVLMRIEWVSCQYYVPVSPRQTSRHFHFESKRNRIGSQPASMGRKRLFLSVCLRERKEKKEGNMHQNIHKVAIIYNKGCRKY